MDRNSKGMKYLAIGAAALIYAGAVVYADVMYLQIMGDVFPEGILGALAMAGAVMMAASALALPVALHFWFSPGLQFIGGIIFWVADIAVLALNSILAFQVASGAVADSFLGVWALLSPASPILAVIGWGILFLLDPSHKLRHAQSGLEADMLDIHAKQLKLAAEDEQVYQVLVEGAKKSAADYAGLLTSSRPSANGHGSVTYGSEVENRPKVRVRK